MAQQKGSTGTVMIGFETTFGTAATTGFVLPVNSFDVTPDQNSTKPGTLTGGSNPSEPLDGNKGASGTIVVPADADGLWYWLKAAFNSPTTTGTDPYVHEYKVTDTIPSITAEQSLPDLATPFFMRYVGGKITSVSTEVGGDGEFVINLGVTFVNYSKESSAFDASPTEVTLGTRIQMPNAALTEGGSTYDDAQTISFSYDRGIDADTHTIGDSGVKGALNEGIISITGALNILMKDGALITKSFARTESSVKMTATQSASAILELEVQELKYKPAGVPFTGPQGVKSTLNYEGFYTNGSEASALVVRLTNSSAHA